LFLCTFKIKMLYNISHHDKKTNQIINDSVGKPFGIIENIKRKGIGSPRLIITKASQEIALILNRNNSINYANIELRPNGIIIGFQSQLEVYALVIPFYKLVIFKPGNAITFHVDHHFVSFEYKSNQKSFSTFLTKIENQKLSQPYFDVN
jgi:hypothetical protein